MKKKGKKVLLFLKNDSVYFSTDIDDFKKIISVLGKMPTLDVQIVDVTQNPELAEEYRIDALPTLVIGNRKYIGQPDPTKAIEIFKKAL